MTQTNPKRNTPEPTETAAPHPLTELLELVRGMSNRLEAIAAQTPPDWQLPLAAYRSAWPDRIAAKVIATDADGIAKVVWCGHTYTRRTGSDKKKGTAIWYSRSTGPNEYGRLITFADTFPAEPLPEYVKLALQNV